MMTKLFRYGLMTILLGTLLSAASVAEAEGQVLNEILRRMDINNRSIQSIKAGVTMTKHNPQLNVSDVSVGTTSYLPKTAKRVMYARIDWSKPLVEHISIIGDAYELYRPRINQVITGKAGKSKNSPSVGGALAFMTMSKAQLKANYEVVYLGEEQISAGTKVWHLQLTPKQRTSYKAAELWVDGDGMPRQVKIVEHNGDSTTVLLTDIVKNQTLAGSIFKLDYPKTVKKIKA